MNIQHLHINKKNYCKPAIEEVELDVAISLNQPSTGEGEQPPLPTSAPEQSSKPDYGSDTYQSSQTPFDSRPAY